MIKMFNFFNLSFLGWIITLIATGGSLFYSEVMEYEPCKLCWYQRIFMYPLVIIFIVSMLKNERKAYLYIAPIAKIGLLIAFYHNLIQWGFISEELSPCVQGVSCATIYLGIFGFLTIPLLSLMAFSLITIITYFLHLNLKASQNE